MKPTSFIKASEPPTLTSLLKRGHAAGLDRFVGVQPARDGNPAAVAIFLMTPAAIRCIGPLLKSHIAKLPQISQKPGEIIQATAETTIPQIISALTQLGHQWVWMDLPTVSPPGLLTIIIGESVTKEFAAELTKRGAICNLT